MSELSHPHDLHLHLMTQPHHDHCASRTKGDGMRCDCWKGEAERLLREREYPCRCKDGHGFPICLCGHRGYQHTDDGRCVECKTDPCWSGPLIKLAPPSDGERQQVIEQLRELVAHIGTERGKMTTLYGEETLLQISEVMQQAADVIQSGVQCQPICPAPKPSSAVFLLTKPPRRFPFEQRLYRWLRERQAARCDEWKLREQFWQRYQETDRSATKQMIEHARKVLFGDLEGREP